MPVLHQFWRDEVYRIQNVTWILNDFLSCFVSWISPMSQMEGPCLSRWQVKLWMVMVPKDESTYHQHISTKVLCCFKSFLFRHLHLHAYNNWGGREETTWLHFNSAGNMYPHTSSWGKGDSMLSVDFVPLSCAASIPSLPTFIVKGFKSLDILIKNFSQMCV